MTDHPSKFKVGQKWKSRDGRRLTITSVYTNYSKDFPITARTDLGMEYSFTGDGCFLRTEEGALDLIELWPIEEETLAALKRLQERGIAPAMTSREIHDLTRGGGDWSQLDKLAARFMAAIVSRGDSLSMSHQDFRFDADKAYGMAKAFLEIREEQK